MVYSGTYRAKGDSDLEEAVPFKKDKEYQVHITRGDVPHKLIFCGINNETTPLIIKETHHFIMLRVPGHKGWVGRNDYQYVPPAYMILEKLAKIPADDNIDNTATHRIKVREEEAYDKNGAALTKKTYLELIKKMEEHHGSS